EEKLARLVQDLKQKKHLCRVKDYPGVPLEELNRGEQPGLFIDEGHFTPYRMVVYGREAVAFEIATQLGIWIRTNGGRYITRKRETGRGKLLVRMPDVAYGPRRVHRSLNHRQVWSYGGEPFAPTFVVEIVQLSGRTDYFVKLDNKMRNEYFNHGVQLGFVIDPRPGYKNMYEYFLDEDGDVQRSVDTTWRDLNGRDVLPGFEARSDALDLVLKQESGSSEEEEELSITCQIPGCGKRLRSLGEHAAHALRHLEDSAMARHRTKRARR
ncbi:TPA: hypothetical protein N0F65_004662, partial [Lagenidium giganteum]